jgi:hypothetical protein
MSGANDAGIATTKAIRSTTVFNLLSTGLAVCLAAGRRGIAADVAAKVF